MIMKTSNNFKINLVQTSKFLKNKFKISECNESLFYCLEYDIAI